MVDTLFEVTCDLANMPASAFQTKSSATVPVGSTLRLPVSVARASFSLDMRVGSADIELDLVYQNVSYGKGSIDYIRSEGR